MTVAEARNPFPGLRPFSKDEEYFFFGREEQVDSMIDRLIETRFLAVVGTSGSGKSSLVNCGLQPALYRGLTAGAGTSWRVAQFRPGRNPLRSLARALARPGVLFDDFTPEGLSLDRIVETTLRMSKLGLIDIYQQACLAPDVSLLVVADQFEELFRFREQMAVQEGADHGVSQDAIVFCNLLLEIQAQTEWPIYVVLTMRSDFLGDCDQFRGLPEAVNRGQYLVPRMTRTERRSAIAGPVAVSGVEIDPALLTRLVNDVGDNPDQLSILQHALNRTWACWQSHGGAGPLRLEHYEEIGTMVQALDRHAEQTFAELDTERKRRLCERMFKALTFKGADLRGTRRPTRLSTLFALAEAEPEELVEVIEVFRHPSCSFLMPPVPEPLEPDTMIDISHESLMRIWNRLRGWVDAESEAARFYVRLAETAELHKAGRAGLWGDLDLQIATVWRRDSEPNAAWAAQYGGDFGLAMEFLDRSQAAWDAEVAAERARQQAETSQRLALQAQRSLPVDHELALLLAVAAGRASATDEAERALRQVIEHRGRSLRRLPHEDSVLGVSWSPDGRRVLTASRDGKARIWDGETGVALAELRHDALVAHAAWSPDGGRVVTASYDRTARIWDAASGEEQARLTGHAAVLAQAAWSPDGRWVVTASYDGTARCWNAATGEPVCVLEDLDLHPLEPGRRSHRSWVTAVAWSPAGRIATAGEDRSAKVWDAATGCLEAVLEGHQDRLRCLAWDGDGGRLATASADGTARLWKATGEALHELRGHGDWIVDLRWSPDGTRLVTASRDGTARIWNTATGEALGSPAQHGGELRQAAWSTDGRRIATGGTAGITTLWDAASGQELAVLTGHRGPILGIAWQPGEPAENRRVATASEDGTARIWDPQPGMLQRLVTPSEDGRPPAIWDAQWSPDCTKIVTGDQSGRVLLWDAASGEVLARFEGHRGPISRVVWLPDGTGIATASRDHRAALWRPAGEEPPIFFEGHRAGVLSAAVHPAGSFLATGGIDRRLRLWSTGGAAGLISDLDARIGWIGEIAWSCDGSRLLTAGYDGLVRIWDVTDPAAPREHCTLAGHTTGVLHAAWSPDCRRVASVGMDGTLRIWNAENGAGLATLHGHEGWTLQVAWRPDGRQVATTGRDGTARLWTLDDLSLERVLSGHQGPVYWAAYSHDGSQLLTAGDDGTARLWHTSRDETGDSGIAVVARHQGRIVRAAWSPQGGRILTAGFDGVARIDLARIKDLLEEASRRAVRQPTREEVELYALSSAEDEPAALGLEPPERRPVHVAAPHWTTPLRMAGIIFSTNNWGRDLRHGMEQGAAEADVNLYIAHHQFDLAQEARLIEDALERRVDAIVISPRDLQASVPMIRKAREQGVMVVCAGTCINHRDAAELVTSFYESDQFELGYRTGLYLAQWVFDQGLAARALNVGIIQCEQFEQCYQRGQGVRTALADAGLRWRELDNREGLIERHAIEETKQMLLLHPEIEVIWTQHDESLRAAVKAVRQLRQQGLAREVRVFGMDLALEMLRAPDDILQATTGQQAIEMGRRAVLDAARALRGEDVGHYHKVLASPLYTRNDPDAAPPPARPAPAPSLYREDA